jgi:hypothetical protein
MFKKYMLKLSLDKIIFLAFLGFSISANSQNTPVSNAAIEKSVSEKSVSSLGASFCIFNVLEYKLTGIKAITFTTDRVSQCKDFEFEKLTAASISAQLQTFMKPSGILKSGTHTLVASKDLSPLSEPYIEIGKFRFRKTGELFINYVQHFYTYLTNPSYRKGTAALSFAPIKVTTDIFLLYDPGVRVYELKSADGKTFTMATFTNYLNPALNVEGLKDLGPSLEFPPGWTYSSRVLDKQISIRSRATFDQTEYVFDNFGNFYIRTQ